MVTEIAVREVLEKLEVPMLGRSLGSLNGVRSVDIDGTTLNIDLAVPALNELAQGVLKVQINKELTQLPGVEEVAVTFSAPKPAAANTIKHVVAVMSGKGGVGKSLVSALLAVGLSRQGKNVGILDADITGPSIPRMFGLKERPIGCAEGFLPVLTGSGIAVMSINLVLPNEDDAVIWRGPLISNTITQFWNEVFWGKLDYLVVDLPPGTADAALTVIKSLPIAGLVIVSTPQELTSMIVKKAISMARDTSTRIIGMVENMSYLEDGGRRIELFGPSRGQEMAEAAGAPLLAVLPVQPALAALCDSGRIESYNTAVVAELARAVDSALHEDEENNGRECRR